MYRTKQILRTYIGVIRFWADSRKLYSEIEVEATAEGNGLIVAVPAEYKFGGIELNWCYHFLT